MILLPREDDGIDLFACLVSDCERIHMGVYPVIFGYRIRAGFYESRKQFYELDYCCGNLQSNVELMYSMVKNILEQQEYSSNIFRCFPYQESKPFFTDIENWLKCVALTKDIEIVKLPLVTEMKRKQLNALF